MHTARCPGCGQRKQLFGGTCAGCLARKGKPAARTANRSRRFGNAPPHTSRWEGKIAGPDFRLQWNRMTWLLEELPKKGKRRLRVATLDSPGGRYGGQLGMDPFIPANILRVARVSPNDSYAEAKTKIAKAMTAATEEVVAKKRAEGDKSWDFLLRSGTHDWNEDDVYFTEVMPEGLEPFNADGKDFVVSLDWGHFKAYDPASDFHLADPHYSLYESSAPASARKLYQLLRQKPDTLRSVSWSSFGPWLTEHKIPFKTRFSSW
jgi:hypothetical protein